MALVVRGLLDQQVALEPGNSGITVKQHRGQVMHKMRAESLADPVRMSEKSDLGAAKQLPPQNPPTARQTRTKVREKSRESIPRSNGKPARRSITFAYAIMA